MPVLSLPLTFANSFWSQDYRKGLQVLYGKLEQGVDENAEIVNFIRARAASERALGQTLTAPAPTGPRDRGFGADEGASLLVTFRALQSESIGQGKAHLALSSELDQSVANPFEEWSHAHKVRVQQSRNLLVDGWLQAYEDGISEVSRLKKTYLNKTRKADEVEDDARFSGLSAASGDPYTASPRINQSHGVVQRTPSVSERISQRLAELQGKKSSTSPTSEKGGSVTSDHEDGAPRILSKDKGKAVDRGEQPEVPHSPLPMSPPPMSPMLPPPKIGSPASANVMQPPPLPMLIAGVAMPPQAVSAMLLQAQSHLPLRSVRFPILGEYPEVFSGEEFATWLVENVPAFQGNLDMAEEAAKELCERDNVLRRIGEFGNKFENSQEAFYQFRPKAFDLTGEHAARKGDIVGSPTSPTPMPFASRIVKRSGTLVNFVSSMIPTNPSGEPPHIKARADAAEASQAYRTAVRQLDRRRLGLEERIEETLKTLQKWETDRLRAVKTVLQQYQSALAVLHPVLKDSIERSTELVGHFKPENDLTALIERSRTGPFRPSVQKYETAAHTVGDVVFGLDLSGWAGEGGWNAVRAAAEGPKDTIPPVLRGLLVGLEAAYKRLPNDIERRKSWIYDVPLPAVHHLRESINSLPPDSPIPAELFEKYDAPVIASTVKLWLLELEPPLGGWEGWDEVRKIYPNVGADSKPEDFVAMARVDDLKNSLQRLPKIHLFVLDALVQHLNGLIESTPDVQEDKDVYVTKLALSVGRAILRPKVETEMAIQDRHPTLFFIDLLKFYSETIPPTILKKKRESERPIPVKKRTAPIDQRMSRSRLSAQGLDPHDIIQSQITHSRSASISRSRAGSVARPPVPALPPVLADPAIHPPPPTTGDEDPDAPPPRPKFAEPNDSEDLAQELFISPPTPQRVPSPKLAGSGPSSPAPDATTPPADAGDQVITAGSATVSRSGSAGLGPRGPRPAKGPRAPLSPGATSLSRPGTHSRNASSVSLSDRPVSPADPRDYAPKGKKVGRAPASAFSRRTMASDAEDEVVDK